MFRGAGRLGGDLFVREIADKGETERLTLPVGSNFQPRQIPSRGDATNPNHYVDCCSRSDGVARCYSPLQEDCVMIPSALTRKVREAVHSVFCGGTAITPIRCPGFTTTRSREYIRV